MIEDYLPNIRNNHGVHEESANYSYCVGKGHTLWNQVAVVDVSISRCMGDA